MFNNLKVQSRLAIILILSIIALIGVGVLGTINGRSLKEEIDKLYEGIKMSKFIFNIRYEITGELEEIFSRASNQEFTADNEIEALKKVKENVEENWTKYVVSPSVFSEESEKKFISLKEQVGNTIKEFDAFLQNAMIEIKKADDLKKVNPSLHKEYQSTKTTLLASINKLIDLHSVDTIADYNYVLTYSNWLENISIACLIFSLLLLSALTWIIIRSIVTPLDYIVKNIDKLSIGVVPDTIEMTSGGELGGVLTAMRNMVQASKKITNQLSTIAAGDLTRESEPRSEGDVLVHSLNDMVFQMRRIIGDIKEEVNSLSSTSQEILSSLTQLSSGATETASAVTETSTTVEELKQTAHISADKANDVLAFAEETLTTVSASEQSVTATIEDMNQIRDRMQQISESILKLSEKSLAIAGFMDAVSEIAEQSNLLAVNAALEAAKAGEQGRSFNIVAQQIRILAEQSKGATVQVKALLAEIQNATNAAVLATDQGSKAVAKGVEQSIQANKAMKELGSKMTRVTQAAGQIAHSNQQQLVGTEQITIAMGNINDATTQHVDQLKQIETALETMNQVGYNLIELTNKYKLSLDQARPREKKSKALFAGHLPTA